ncbi:MAG TPA: hypothetical protein VMA13_12650 [Candidatus Saccharimonadales bacterium]|nr:hypothetical protein [Candidatus Saccharimonadales bacterium]
MNKLLRQSAFGEIAQRLKLQALCAPPEVAPVIKGHALAIGTASRLPERGATLVLILARRHAGNPKFHELCQAMS